MKWKFVKDAYGDMSYDTSIIDRYGKNIFVELRITPGSTTWKCVAVYYTKFDNKAKHLTVFNDKSKSKVEQYMIDLTKDEVRTEKLLTRLAKKYTGY